jgi:hypothetical protein
VCAPTKLSTSAHTPGGVAVGASEVYWVNRAGSNGGIAKAPLSVGATTTLVSSPSSPAYGIAADATYVYFGEGANLRRVPIGGGTVDTLSTNSYVAAIALNAGELIWTDLSQLLKMPVGGGAVTVLANGLRDPYGGADTIAVDATRVFWTDLGTYPAYTDGAVRTVKRDGTGLMNLATGRTMAKGLGIDGTHVYWVDANGLFRVNKDGTGLKQMSWNDGVTTDDHGFAVDGGYIYWGTGYDLLRVPITGGPPLSLASGDPEGLAIDASYVYWSDGRFDISRVSK